mgnify:CR=1 FL=1
MNKASIEKARASIAKATGEDAITAAKAMLPIKGEEA